MGEFFVRRPIVAIVLSIFIVLIGLLALKSVPISQYPEITPPTIKINTSFVGANAVNVEQGVAASIEQKINGVEEMIYMKSTNASDGNLSLDVSFKVGTNLDNANMLTQNRVSQATPFMPPSVKQFGITTKKSLTFNYQPGRCYFKDQRCRGSKTSRIKRLCDEDLGKARYYVET
jgi:HAE1 family hydrophobic/amphiphilic exporter-1